MAEGFQDVTFRFRFTSLSEGEFIRLRELLPGTTFRSRSRGAGLTVVFKLTESFDLGSLCTFVRESGVDPNQCSLRTSVVSSSDQGGAALPAHILEVVRRISCGVEFSFVSCLGDSPGTSLSER